MDAAFPRVRLGEPFSERFSELLSEQLSEVCRKLSSCESYTDLRNVFELFYDVRMKSPSSKAFFSPLRTSFLSFLGDVQLCFQF